MIPRDDDDELAEGSYAPGQAAQATAQPGMAQQQPASTTGNGIHNPSAATQAAAAPVRLIAMPSPFCSPTPACLLDPQRPLSG